MKLVKVAAAVVNQTPLAWDANVANIVGAIQSARRQGASLLCLPELCITGYGCEDAFHSPGVQRTALEVLGEVAIETQDMVVSLGLPVWHSGGLFNAACLVANGQIAGFVGKQNLAGDGIHYEPRWFKPWPDNIRSTVEVQGRKYPIGDLVFDCDGVRIGFEICEDAWVGERPGQQLAGEGVDIILNPSASHFAFGKHEVRRRFVLEGSRAFQVSYVYANLLGNEAGRAIYDGDAMIASSGKMLATGARFSYADYLLTTAVIDVDETRMNRARTASFHPKITESLPNRVETDFAFPDAMPELAEVAQADWEAGPNVKEEEFTRAVSLGLFDYLRKSHSRGFVVSLSGGADSAGVAVLVGMMSGLTMQELGREGVAKKLAYLGNLEATESPRELVGQLLTCVYQSTRNSSDTTRSAARQVAEAVGGNFIELDVDATVQGYVKMIGESLGRDLNWEQDDIALQNIQARARAPSVWLLANVRGALLLSTSNRSEAAVGYATMDGDTSGGLSPIAGIDKAFLRAWLHWMEQLGPHEIGPLPELSAVNQQQPTAELRPLASKQTDEDDLMPYELLDAIERAAIRDKLLPVEVYQRLQPQFAHYSRKQMVTWIDRFFRLWSRNQWKRERYAPSFHLDDENLDPKTWCRFPILSGGFERELRELRKFG